MLILEKVWQLARRSSQQLRALEDCSGFPLLFPQSINEFIYLRMDRVSSLPCQHLPIATRKRHPINDVVSLILWTRSCSLVEAVHQNR